MQKRLFNFLKANKYFFFIILFALILRFAAVDKFPSSLNWDEVSHGYNAYSILKTGRDEWGEKFPNIFRAYGDYKLPFYIYVTALSVDIFGLNEFAVRLPSVLAGIGTVIFTYFLVKKLFINSSLGVLSLNHERLAGLSSLLVAIEPWSLFLSRGAFEANLALFLFVAGAYFFLKGLESPRFMVLSAVFFSLTVWTYNSYRIFSPLFLIALVLIFRKELKLIYSKSKHLVLSLVFLVLLFLVPMFYQLLSPIGQARYGEVSILDQGMISQINEARGRGCPRIKCNKIVTFSKIFVENYISNFSPKFLFLQGGSHYQFSIPGQGILYLSDMLFFFLGIAITILKALKLDYEKNSWARRRWLMLLAWLILAPIPACLTRETPHVLRLITILPIPMILSSVGFVWFVRRLKYASLATLTYVIIAVLFLENYAVAYFGDYAKNYSWSWQYGYKEVVLYVKEKYDNYDKIIVTKKYGEPHEYFLFYWPWNPEEYINDPKLNRFYQSKWWWVDGFDKFYFVNDWQIRERERDGGFILESKKEVDCKDSKCLLVTSPDNYPESWQKLKTVNFLDGKPAFEILEK